MKEKYSDEAGKHGEFSELLGRNTVIVCVGAELKTYSLLGMFYY
jgi:hypothetical protein